MPKEKWKERTIRSSLEIRGIVKNGKRIRTSLYDVIYSEKDGEEGRFGVIVGKKLGKAAFRNRIKRRFREILRKEPFLLRARLDLLLLPKRTSSTESAEALRAAVQKTLNEITQ